MPIQENALNSALAQAISEIGFFAVPEETRKSTGAKRCDVQVRQKSTDNHYTALECKIGQDVTQQQAAVKDAQRWLKKQDKKKKPCWNAVALCYPKSLSIAQTETPLAELRTTNDLLMVRVNQAGTVSHWHRGGISELIKLVDDVGAETYAITLILQEAFATASEQIPVSIEQALAKKLELPWTPGKNGRDPRPAHIACLIVANMALLQNRMHAEGIDIDGLEPLMVIEKAPNLQRALRDNWECIRKKDYAPVVEPALAVLYTLPTSDLTESLLEVLIKAVNECAPRVRGLRLDHAGPLYHQLLQTAKYDGSFYTSTSAAILLAELAMPPSWGSLHSDWKDPDRLASLKICDPACGTGTLLMAAARTIEERFRLAGGQEDDIPPLHLSLIENVLHGLDINRHAIHLAASMLTLSAPKIDYNRMNLYNMRHGINEDGNARAGSLDLLTGNAEYIPGLAPPH